MSRKRTGILTTIPMVSGRLGLALLRVPGLLPSTASSFSVPTGASASQGMRATRRASLAVTSRM